MSGRGHSRWPEVLLTAVAVASVAVLLLRLDADLPTPFPIDYALDEGYWLYNARNHALFGRWVLDDFNQAWLGAPLFTLAVRGVFAVLGVSYYSSRLVSALATLGSAALLWWLGRREPQFRLAPWLFLCSSFVMGYGHVALVEPLAGMLALAGLVVLLRVSGARGAVGAGVLIGLAGLAKPVFLVVLLATVVDLWPRRRLMAIHLATALLVYAPVAGGLLWTHWAEAARLSELYALSSGIRGPARVARNALNLHVANNPLGLGASPFIALSPLLAAALVLGFDLKRDRGHRLMGLASLAVVVSLLPLDNRPGRRFYLLAAPAALLASRLVRGPAAPSWRRVGVVAAILLGPWLSRVSHAALGFVLPQRVGIEGWAAVVLVVSLSGTLLIPRNRFSWPSALSWLLVLGLALEGIGWNVWAASRAPYQLRDTSAALRAEVEQGLVVGSAAPSLCLQTEARAVRSMGSLNRRLWLEADFGLVVMGVFGTPYADSYPEGVRVGDSRDLHLLAGTRGEPRLHVRLLELDPAPRGAGSDRR